MFHNTAPPRAEVLERQSSVYPKEQNVMLQKGASVPFISAAINKNIENFQLNLLGKQIKKKKKICFLSIRKTLLLAKQLSGGGNSWWKRMWEEMQSP